MNEAKQRIKICGITSAEEIAMLNESGVEYAGFVFAPGSKRNLTLQAACELKKMLLPQIQSVAVTVSPTQEFARRIEQAGFDVLQVHGRFDAAIPAATNIRLWRAVNLKGHHAGEEEELFHAEQEVLASQRIEAIVLDAAEAGSGKTFDWNRELAGQIKNKLAAYGKSLVLAGGLNEKNVAGGIALFSPQIVDVSSGVEKTGGKMTGPPGKDVSKIRAFVNAVRMG